MHKLTPRILLITLGFALFASCGSNQAPVPSVPAKGRPGVVVFSFEVKSASLPASLGDDVAQSLTEALLKGKQMRPVERQELVKILQEQEFSQSGLVAESDALRIGKIAGAKFILLGSVSAVGDQVRINARMLDVETSEITLADSVYGPMKNIFTLEEQLARKIELGAK